ncbi:GRAM and VASt domain-containing protein KNAG_0L00200 [Huiozyma naganishii CBS 8797]|uniref:VASt domain-containing protein n=1 Tax=Huiozyma naganishii (strain ATCC MYA-139 / BCRC 22969 / CBS 8797 / KCTC 17520 / NBRC 10181 / NCYC 3082 / Yp74L-3) TaxID=1071383 RepID=J7RRY2_HUIN7|nr:hypothetical protein KNAG_0L00200 [Kazachstania naganishii CBS 8797]CCK72643.1 hypothetical protein KNAG_0L00200 [Kazachstania naganishii CBS 8797]
MGTAAMGESNWVRGVSSGSSSAGVGTAKAVPVLELRCGPSTATAAVSEVDPVAVGALVGPQDSVQFPSTRAFITILLSSFGSTGQGGIPGEADVARFHELFKTIPGREQPLAKFACVLNRGDGDEQAKAGAELSPYVGELYLTGSHLCFATGAASAGWLFTRLQISHSQIVRIYECEGTGSNGIAIETNLGKVRFNGFATQGKVLALMKMCWNEGHGADGEALARTLQAPLQQPAPPPPQAVSDPASSAKRAPSLLSSMIKRVLQGDRQQSVPQNNESLISSAVKSIDGDTNPSTKQVAPGVAKTAAVYVLKPQNGLEYTYTGPLYREYNTPVKLPADRAKNETELCNLHLDAAPGVVWELLFSESETAFSQETLRDQESKDVTPFGPFTDNKRAYSYVKKLAYPIGPKSTICHVEEEILHYDPNGYCELLSTTKTPNVPSGGAFSVKTRYVIYWDGPTTCSIKFTFWVEWTGSSWIKSMVESSCKSGLEEAAVELKKLIQRYVSQNVTEETITLGPAAAEQDTVLAKVSDATEEQTQGAKVVENVTVVQEKQTVVQRTALNWRNCISLAVIILLVLNFVVMARLSLQLGSLNPAASADTWRYFPKLLPETPARQGT